MARKKQLETESKRLLDLVINSIHTRRGISLRELIPNVGDTIGKLYYQALSDNLSGVDTSDFKIYPETDKENRTLTICDNSLGMSKDELEDDLGTIMKSGSLAFKQEMENVEEKDDVDIVGQLSVGFYSAFMVVSRVGITMRKYGEETAYLWSGNVVDSHSIGECEKDEHGTEIILYLKDDTEDENYDDYPQQYEIERLIKKYSDHIHYLIGMWVEASERVDGPESENEDADKSAGPKYEAVEGSKTLNSIIPLQERSRPGITEEEYDEFYKSRFNDYTEPWKVIHTSVEGAVPSTTLTFIPGKAPFNYYSQDYKEGPQLYSHSASVMDNAEELIPEYFRFVKGLVSSQDLSLSISREMLQHSHQLKVIANRIEEKTKSELLLMLRGDHEEYEKFRRNFGLQVKFSVHDGLGANKGTLQDLLMSYSNKGQKLVTLDGYINRMEEEQEHTYFMSGDKVELIDNLPQVKKVKEKGYEILYLTGNVDEFVLQTLMNCKEKAFKNIFQGGLDLDSEGERKELEKEAEESKDPLSDIKEVLGDKVKDARVPSRLVDNPIRLGSEESISFEVEKVLGTMPEGNPHSMRASRILEINPNHKILNALQEVYEQDKDVVKDYAGLLYNQALLIEGFPIENPVEFSKKICDLMAEASK